MNTANLSTADLAELERILAADIAFIDYPALHGLDAERRLFTDAPVIPAPNSSWLLSRLAHAPRSGEPLSQLSPLDESLLFMQFNYCRMRTAQLAGAARADDTAARELLAWHRRAIDLRNRIVEYFLPFVLFLAGKGDNGRKFQIDGYDFDDVVSEGMRAMIRAVELHDPSKGELRPYAAITIRGYFSHLVDKVRTYRRVYRAELEGSVDGVIAGKLGAESVRRWKSERVDEQHAHLVEQLRVVLHENRAGLTDLERTILEARYRGAVGRKPLTPIARIAGMVRTTTTRISALLRGVMGKLRSALDRATEMTKAAQLIIARRLRGETEAAEAAARDEANGKARTWQPRTPWRGGAWGVHLLSLAAKIGIHSYQQLAERLGVSVVHAWRMLRHDTMPALRQSTREALCKALGIEPDQLSGVAP